MVATQPAITTDPALLRPTWAAGLTDKQYSFVREYLVDLNGPAAAVRSGYKPTSASMEAHRALGTPRIASAIEMALIERTGVNRVMIVDEVAKIAFANAGDYFTWDNQNVIIRDSSKLTPQQRSAISEVTETVSETGRNIKLRMYNKLAALELLAKLLTLSRQAQDASNAQGQQAGPTVTLRFVTPESIKIDQSNIVDVTPNQDE